MSFIILLLSGLIFYIENNSEDIINVEINELWIKVSEYFYDYSKIDSYTFIYEWENAVILRLNLQKKWIKIIDLKIDNTVVLELKQILPCTYIFFYFNQVISNNFSYFSSHILFILAFHCANFS